jgi:hypothetical protein
MIAKFVAPSLERLRQFLIEPPPGVRDVEVRRKSRLLAILLPLLPITKESSGCSTSSTPRVKARAWGRRWSSASSKCTAEKSG